MLELVDAHRRERRYDSLFLVRDESTTLSVFPSRTAIIAEWNYLFEVVSKCKISFNLKRHLPPAFHQVRQGLLHLERSRFPRHFRQSHRMLTADLGIETHGALLGAFPMHQGIALPVPGFGRAETRALACAVPLLNRCRSDPNRCRRRRIDGLRGRWSARSEVCSPAPPHSTVARKPPSLRSTPHYFIRA